jgi:hypothetical protein
VTPCLSRWGSELPGWVCDLAGGSRPTVGEVRAGNERLAVVLLVALAVALIVVAVLDALRGRRSWRDWWDRLR